MRIIITILVFLASFSVYSQTYYDLFISALEKEDTLEMHNILTEWESKTPEDAEIFPSWFNYYLLKSRDELMALDEANSLAPKYVFNDSIEQDSVLVNMQVVTPNLDKGFEYIDRGIELYPLRLDMRFGKIHILGMTQDWDVFTQEVLDIVDYAVEIDNRWEWTYGDSVIEAKDFFLRSVHDYVMKLYYSGNDSLLINMREVSFKILSHYPNHIESLTDVATTYTLLKDYSSALEYLNKAEAIDSNDCLVLANLGQNYKLLEQKEKALYYFNKIIEICDEDYGSFARTNINELKDN
jgi:tetratricopeptide (TPR) repeat protein